MIFVLVFFLAIVTVLAGTSPLIGAMILFVPDLVITGTPSAIIAGYNIYIMDLVSVCFLIVSAVRYFSNGSPHLKGSHLWRLLLLFSALALLSFIRGAPIFGKTAVVNFRPDFYAFSAIAYFSSFMYGKKQVRRLLIGFLFITSIMAVIGVVKFFDLFTIPTLFQSEVSDIQYTSVHRTLNSEQAMAMGTSFFLLLVLILVTHHKRKPTVVGLASFMFLFLVVAAVRSVWLATAAGIITLLLVLRSNWWVPALRFLTGALLISFLIWATDFQSAWRPASELVYEGAIDPFTNPNSTASWRVAGWIATFSNMSWDRFLIGSPYGTPKWRFILGQDVNYSLHNYFLQILFSVGIAGLLPFLLLQWRLIQGLRRQVRIVAEPWFSILSLSLLVTLVGCLVYFLAYDGSYVYDATAGIAISVLSRQRLRRGVQ